VRPEGLCQLKIPVTPLGIELATFRLVAQCLNQLRYRVHLNDIFQNKIKTPQKTHFSSIPKATDQLIMFT
jgi:hypothetical protein